MGARVIIRDDPPLHPIFTPECHRAMLARVASPGPDPLFPAGSRTTFEGLRARIREECIPANVTLEITLRCNLRCVHCYNFDRALPYLPLADRDQELSDPEVFRILGEIQAAGCITVTFTGGEALVHPGLDAFVRHARSLGMIVVVKSNGVLLDPPTARRLADAGVSRVDVSVYGAEGATHDAFVKVAGAFARTMEGAKAAKAAGLEVGFSFVLTRGNAGELEAMMAWARVMDIPFAVDPQVTARYDGSRSSLDERVDRATLEQIYRGPLRVPAAACRPDRSVQCSCARTVAAVSAHGVVYPCIGAPMPAGNIREKPFAEIWKTSPVFQWIRGLTLDDFKACQPCEHRLHCRRSSGVVFVNTGNYTGPERFGDDWTCMEAEVLHRIHDESPPVEPADSAGAGALRRHSQDD
ncbi:MAG: radical SAM protein [Gemmatimonadales bacterium]|nr:radical SAM protein [Gemmatimonadales bacterium]